MMDILAPQISVKPRIAVILPYVNERLNIEQAVHSWFKQSYKNFLLTIINFSFEPISFVNVDQKNLLILTPKVEFRWNPSLAKNIGARLTHSDYIVFTTPNILPDKDFLELIGAQWDQAELLLAESLVNNVPSSPELKNLIVIKRWVNTKIRGFNEEMMFSPHGWGYDSEDYILRAQKYLSTCGGRLKIYPIESIKTLSLTDKLRVEPFEVKDMTLSFNEHQQYSQKYIKNFGYIGNFKKEWGDNGF